MVRWRSACQLTVEACQDGLWVLVEIEVMSGGLKLLFNIRAILGYSDCIASCFVEL